MSCVYAMNWRFKFENFRVFLKHHTLHFSSMFTLVCNEGLFTWGTKELFTYNSASKWSDFHKTSYVALSLHVLRTMSVWLRSVSNEGHFDVWPCIVYENDERYQLDATIIIIFLHGLGWLTCSSINALPYFPGASTTSSPPRFVVEGVSEVWCCPFFRDGWSSSVCIWISRLVFQRSLVLFLWLRFVFCLVLCIPEHFLESASLQLLGEPYRASWLPMFRCHKVVSVWLRLYRISFGCLCGFSNTTYALESVYFLSKSSSLSKLSSHPK